MKPTERHLVAISQYLIKKNPTDSSIAFAIPIMRGMDIDEGEHMKMLIGKMVLGGLLAGGLIGGCSKAPAKSTPMAAGPSPEVIQLRQQVTTLTQQQQILAQQCAYLKSQTDQLNGQLMAQLASQTKSINTISGMIAAQDARDRRIISLLEKITNNTYISCRNNDYTSGVGINPKSADE